MQQVQDRPCVYTDSVRATGRGSRTRGTTVFFRLLATDPLHALDLDYNFAISFHEPILTGCYTIGRLWTSAVWHEMHRGFVGGGEEDLSMLDRLMHLYKI